MKKLYFLFLLLTPFFVNAQGPWEFNTSGDTENWTEKATFNCAVAQNGTNLDVTFKATKKNPAIQNLAANVTTTGLNFIAVTLKNASNDGPTYLRMSYPKTSDASKLVYKAIAITKGDTDFQTYYIDVTNASEWTGVKDDILLYFKVDNGTTGGGDYTVGAVDAILQIDRIEFIANIPTAERQTYNFDTDDDSEGWSQSNGSITGPTSGALTFSPTVDKYAKINLNGGPYHVNTTLANTLNITLQNLSTNDDQLRVIVAGESIIANDKTISTSDASEKTYSFLLTDYSNWTGNVSDIQIGFRDADRPNTGGTDFGVSSGTGNFIINSIIFDNTLGVDDVDLKDDASISLYPNPVQHVLNVKASSNINKIEVYNILGQHVLSIKNSNSIDVQQLNKGAYITKIFQDNDIVSTKRFFKN